MGADKDDTTRDRQACIGVMWEEMMGGKAREEEEHNARRTGEDYAPASMLKKSGSKSEDRDEDEADGEDLMEELVAEHAEAAGGQVTEDQWREQAMKQA
jgi:hypothetical protein